MLIGVAGLAEMNDETPEATLAGLQGTRSGPRAVAQ
jgi:hypothetical protein